MNTNTTLNRGAADLPEALHRSTAADGKTELFNLPGYPLMVRAVDFNRIHTESEMRMAALLDEMQKAALAAGQATAAQPAPATQQAREVSDAMVLAALQVQYPATYGQYLRHPADGPKTSIRTEAEIDTARRMIAAALAAAPQPSPTAQADSVQEDAAWMPLTPELLTAIESGDLGNRFWIAAHNSNEPQIGVYEWRQGRNPHGFNSDLSRYGASEITHVLPYKPPALPAASGPQARSKP